MITTRLTTPLLAFAVALGGALPLAAAAHGGDDHTHGNGFPKGPHLSLHLLGKPNFFSCPPGQVDEETGEPEYGKVI